MTNIKNTTINEHSNLNTIHASPIVMQAIKAKNNRHIENTNNLIIKLII